MKFNPLTNKLFTNDNQFLKKLNCPYNLRWQDLSDNSHSTTDRTCSKCSKIILDTSKVKEDELKNILTLNPSTCIKIDLDDIILTYK